MDEPRLRGLIEASPNRVGLAGMTLLAWLAAADGGLDANERQHLRELARANQNEEFFGRILPLAELGSVDDLQLACEVVRVHLNPAQRRLFLELAIGVALGDGLLSAAENHVLRFFADLVGIAPVAFNELFRNHAGRDLPAPGDPSSMAWWRSRRGGASTSSGSAGKGRTGPRAVLGVADDASTEEIKRAFRRLAMLHHPDRFHELGPAAVAEAERQFKRIGAAYEELVDGGP